jgi:hypothetical protein
MGPVAVEERVKKKPFMARLPQDVYDKLHALSAKRSRLEGRHVTLTEMVTILIRESPKGDA